MGVVSQALMVQEKQYPIDFIPPNIRAEIVDCVSCHRSIDGLLIREHIQRVDFFNYVNNHPFFKQELNIARETAIDFLVDELPTIADDCQTLVDVGAKRIKAENIRWLAAARKPQSYGARLDVKHSHTLDLSNVLAAADARTLPLLEAKRALRSSVIEAESKRVEVQEPEDSAAVPSTLEELL